MPDVDMDKKIKVGFDMDGVLLYNPVRTLRPVAEVLKQIIKGDRKASKSLYIPKTKLEIWLWKLLHMTSLFPAGGIDKLKQILRSDHIEAHIVTARYQCLENDFHHWLDRLEASKFFTKSWHNVDNEQPHLFKERKIKELGLQYFFEDNWFIVDHLYRTVGNQTKIFWISNPLDYQIKYQYKFHNFQEAIEEFSRQIKQ